MNLRSTITVAVAGSVGAGAAAASASHGQQFARRALLAGAAAIAPALAAAQPAFAKKTASSSIGKKSHAVEYES